jgi:hypothetical protein
MVMPTKPKERLLSGNSKERPVSTPNNYSVRHSQGVFLSASPEMKSLFAIQKSFLSATPKELSGLHAKELSVGHSRRDFVRQLNREAILSSPLN